VGRAALSKHTFYEHKSINNGSTVHLFYQHLFKKRL
jgi:hypothetical protein